MVNKWSGQFGQSSTELYLIKGRVQQLFERPLGKFPIKNICIILGHNKYEYHFFVAPCERYLFKVSNAYIK